MSINREWLEKDYYQVLGVPSGATQSEIKKAYRRLAQQLHPDAHPGDKGAEDRFKEVSAAYDILGDANKRKEYDRVREMARSGLGFGGGPGWPGGGGARIRFEDLGFGEGLGDLFDLFGGGSRRGRRARGARARGADLETEVHLSFEDAARGVTVPVNVTGTAPCERCGGSGAEPGTQVSTCPECGGSGTVAVDQGLFSLSRACPRCGGSGRVVERPCRNCGGSGHTRSTRTLKVKVPPGIEDGARIRLAGRGDPGPRGGQAGDLFVVVRVAAHPHFGRKGPHLTLRLPITFPEAALGANVKVPTLNGVVTLKVPPGTASGRTFRVRGEGLPKRDGSRGDLLVTVDVQVPTRLSKRERELLEQFREAHPESPRTGLGV